MSLEEYQRKLAYILYPTVFNKRDEYKQIADEYNQLNEWLTFPKQNEAKINFV